MTLIQVINPNTSRAMTSAIGRAAREAAGPGVTVRTVQPDSGPEAIESHYDAALAVPGVLSLVSAGGADGQVIACFGDPGLDAARELSRGPVVGIAEAAMHVATFLGRSFSVVTTLSRTVGHTLDLVYRYGFERACRGVHASGLPVLGLESPGALEVVARECARARDADDCDVIVLGCAGMSAMAGPLAQELGVPVVDGVSAAVRIVGSLVALGLRTSTRGEYAMLTSRHAVG
jgi:allantoin racemase